MRLRTFLERPKIYSLFILALILCFLGCASSPEAQLKIGPKEKVYHQEFDQVWRATQIALAQYPIRINNMDRGLLETEVIKGYDVWTPPYNPDLKTGGLRYKLIVRVIKGNLKGKPAIKVSIFKNMSIQKDFFSKEKDLPSDGLEEISLLYRIQRELKLENALIRLSK